MSNTTKGAVLRLIMPQDSSAKMVSSLGPSAKVESTSLVLRSGRLTTEDIVRNIREFTRLRDELIHTLRQLGIPREPRKGMLENPDYGLILSEAQKQLEDRRKRLQETQARVEGLDRQIEESKKQVGRLGEVADAGFVSEEALPKQGEFARILGRLPLRKLEAAQRALQATLKDQVVLATGNRKKDWVYVLLASPPEKTSPALQTLILYDFVQTEVPTSEEPDLKKALASLEEKKEKLSKELETSKEEMKTVRSESGETLNRLTDRVQDALMLLRAVLKMGEDASVTHVFAWVEKTPPAKMINALSSQGALVEAE